MGPDSSCSRSRLTSGPRTLRDAAAWDAWVAGLAAVVLVFFMCRVALADAAALVLSMVAK